MRHVHDDLFLGTWLFEHVCSRSLRSRSGHRGLGRRDLVAPGFSGDGGLASGRGLVAPGLMPRRRDLVA
ncbi:hypothetical protein [Nannocystis sp. SCPEA4]|uniref:hypothetical protein n=1 Tax=Nannocystis sp. SCPEA4 TaxID=2996787 RepID=UPI002271F078|nr:hypothetical protein [Nannocystis sp. SCPEA4]MCY1057742.1 hypothetical protein [Nannocystis sp. SCPEA4]